jgi:hypothetical protein
VTADTVQGFEHAGHALSPLADFALNFVIVFGPGIALVGALVIAWPAARGIYRGIRHITTWQQARSGIGLLASYANNEHTRDLLDDFKPSRKENPQP